MPGYKTHLVGGVVAFVVVSAVLFGSNYTGRGWVVVGGFFACLLASITSDVDIRTSIIFKLWAFCVSMSTLALLVMTVLSAKELVSLKIPINYYFAAAVVMAVFLASLFLKHRKIMHTYKMAAFLSAGTFLLSPFLAPFVFAGYSSHLLLDKFVKSDD